MRSWPGLLFIVALPLLVAFAPLLFFGRVIVWGDDLNGAANLSFLAQAIRAGDSFLWNPDNLFGFPIHATLVGFFAPWNYLLALTPSPFTIIRILPWIVAIAFVLGGLILFSLLRTLGLSRAAALIGVAGYTASHQLNSFLPVATNLYFFLPLLFFCMWRMAERPGWRWALAGGVGLGLGWLSSSFQEMLYITTGLAAFVLFLAVRARGSADGSRSRRIVGWALVVFALGFAIGAIQILPTRLMAQESTRARGVSYALAVEDAMLPSDFARFLLPGVKLPLGIPFGSRGAATPLYIGIVPLFCLGLALFGRRRLASLPEPARAFGWFCRWLFWGSLALAIAWSPLYWLTTRLPFFSYFRIPDRWLILAEFAMSVLAAIGAEILLRTLAEGGIARLKRAGAVFLSILGLALAFLIAMNVMFAAFEPSAVAGAKSLFARYGYARYQPAGIVPLAHYEAIIERYFGDLHRYFSFGKPQVAVGALAIIASGAVLLFVFRGRLGRREAALLLVAVATANAAAISAVNAVGSRTMPVQVHGEIPPTVSFLRSAPPGRVLPVLYENFEQEVMRPRIGMDGADRFRYWSAILVPNGNLLYGLPSAALRDSLEPRAASRLIELVGGPVGRPTTFPQGDPVAASKLLAQEQSLLAFLGIRYLISGYPMDENVFPRVFSANVTSAAIPISVYENSSARPLAYLADQVMFVSGGEPAVFVAFQVSKFSALLVECRTICPQGPQRFSPGTVNLREHGNGHAVIDTTSDGPAFLIFSENNLPGWRAFIDGREVGIDTVNTVFIGLALPAGAHVVELRYENPCAGARAIKCAGLFLTPRTGS